MFSSNSKVNKYIIILIIIISIASCVRLYNIKNRGLFSYDSPYYLREAKFMYSVSRNFKLFFELLTGKNVSVEDIKSKIEGVPPVFNPKPIHSLLLGIFSIIFGMKDYTGALYSTLFAVFSFIMLYKIVKEISDERTALISVLILSFSVFHISFSRMPYPDTDSSFFFLFSIYILLKNKNTIIGLKSNFTAGVLFAIAGACNYRILWLAAFFVLFYVYLDRKNSIMRIIMFIIGMAAVISIINIPYVLAKTFKAFPDNFETYFDLLYRYYIKQQNPITYAAVHHFPAFYPHKILIYFLVKGESLFFAIILFLSSALLIILGHRKKEYIIILGIALIPIILFSFTSRGNRSVAFSPSLPFMAASISLALKLITEKYFNKKYLFSYIIVIVLILFNIPNIYKELNATSGYKEMSEYLIENNGIYHITTNEAMPRFYINRYSGILSSNIPSYKYVDKIKYFVKDLNYYYYTGKYKSDVDYVIKTGKLIKTIDNNFVRNSVVRFDQYLHFFDRDPNLFFTVKGIDKIEIYEIDIEKLKRYFKKSNE